MKHVLATLLAVAIMLGGAMTVSAEKHGDADVTYARVKEFTPGQKIVFDVDNAVDKSFDLTEKDVRFTIGKNLKVGDPVKITERTVNGKKVVQVTHHTGGGVKHGDKPPKQ